MLKFGKYSNICAKKYFVILSILVTTLYSNNLQLTYKSQLL
jgi:hypothetical protein